MKNAIRLEWGGNMKAVTVWQPWATCIRERWKPCENRTWLPWKQLIGHYIAVHAGATVDQEAIIELEYAGLVPSGLIYQRSAIICVARYCGPMPKNIPSPWKADGQKHWWLKDVIKLEPIPCKGAQGLWEVPTNIVYAIHEQLRAQDKLVQVLEPARKAR